LGQSFVICSSLFLILSIHDASIWTWHRTNALLTLEILITLIRVIEYSSNLTWLAPVAYFLMVWMAVLVAFFGAQWTVKHFVVLYEVFGWSKISVAVHISSDEYMIMCYICANFVLTMCTVAVVHHAVGLYIQTAVATVMILCPGRVARRNAVHLDVSL
jgi:hypothetical protein